MHLVLELPGCAFLLCQRGVGIGATRVGLIRDAPRRRSIFQTTISLLTLRLLVGFVGVVVNQRVQRSIRSDQRGVKAGSTRRSTSLKRWSSGMNDSRSMTVLAFGSKTCNPCISGPMAGNRGNVRQNEPANTPKPLHRSRGIRSQARKPEPTFSTRPFL